MTATYRLLIAYAHPDDESFGSGGLIAKYATNKVEVSYICATNGDMGTISASYTADYDSVADVRLRELETAAKVLGIQRTITFGYKDSGMMGSDSANDPDCLWYHWQTNPDHVIQRVVDVIRDIKPQVIVTFNQYGGYGHPDHIAIQQATTKAFTLAGDTSYRFSDLPAYAPQKLYYASIPADKFFRFYLMLLRLKGQDIRRLGVNKDLDYQAVLDHLEPIHTVVDLSKVMDVWDQASDCHLSQGQGRGSGTRGMMANLPRWLRHRIASNYGLTRIHPKPAYNKVIESDLFENVISE